MKDSNRVIHVQRKVVVPSETTLVEIIVFYQLTLYNFRIVDGTVQEVMKALELLLNRELQPYGDSFLHVCSRLSASHIDGRDPRTVRAMMIACFNTILRVDEGTLDATDVWGILSAFHEMGGMGLSGSQEEGFLIFDGKRSGHPLIDLLIDVLNTGR